jgi:hypothetical protein
MKIIIRIYKGKKVVKRLIANKDKWRKAYAKLASAVGDKYFVRVEYGEARTNFDHTVCYSDGMKTKKTDMFYNEYEGTSVTEAKHALQAFMEGE